VTDVSWHDAAAYCAWLGEKTNRHYLLPSEAEWEKAASWVPFGGQGSSEGSKRPYPWGRKWLDGRCNVGSGTTPVTAHPSGASAYGVEDLLGNVQEWTRSLWGERPDQADFRYPYDAADGREILDPAELPVRARLVHRGGSFRSAPTGVRCTARGNSLSDSKVAWRGLRVAMTIA
jgi:iron(II)-dependent oxidoreductase